MKYLNAVANVALIIGVVIASAELLHRRTEAARPEPTQIPKLVGSRLAISGVRFSETRNSLVIVMSTSCHFCKDSLPFYRRLSEQTDRPFELVTILPQSVTESSDYLDKAGIKAEKVISANLGPMGIWATPTLLLVDRGGTIKDVWVGRLDQGGERSVLTKLVQN